MAATRSILDRIRLAAAAGRALAPEDGAALAKAIERAERDGISVDAALGLPRGWQRAARVRKRDAALRALATTIGGGDRERARQIHARLIAYAKDGQPVTLADNGRPRLLELQILDANAGDVLGVEAIRKVLGG